MSAHTILNQSFLEMRQALDENRISSVQLTEAALSRLSKHKKITNATLLILQDQALSAARAADERLQKGERGPMLGIPVGIKDLILLKGAKTTAASKMLKDFVPPYDAHVVEALKKAGAVCIAKLNLDEFAMGSSNENSAFGAVKNPWNLECVPGGSSGGSAAAVASRDVPVALGTDTGGSIRQPASLTGTVGLKPTYGRVSRFGVVAFASSLDQVGPMGVDVAATAALLDVISGFDGRDATSQKYEPTQSFAKVEALSKTGNKDFSKLKIGYIPELLNSAGLSEGVRKTFQTQLDKIKTAGATLVELSMPELRASLAAYYIICSSEASSNLARYNGVHVGHRTDAAGMGRALSVEELYSKSRSEGFGPEVKTRILLGSFALSAGSYDAYFKKAAQVRRLIFDAYKKAFASVDFILTPTSPTPAFKTGEKVSDPVTMYLSDVFTIPVNLAGLPALSLPMGFENNLPLGMQVIAPWWKEEPLMEFAWGLEKLFAQSSKLSPLALQGAN